MIKKNINIHALPIIDRVIITSGVCKYKTNENFVKEVEEKLSLITLQKPLKCYAKISEANFQLREGELIGFKVNLRSYKQWFFLEKLITIAIFKLSGFSGLSVKSIQKDGNYSFGVNDIIAFPEIVQNKLKYNFGIDIHIITRNSNKDLTLDMLKSLGLVIIIK